MGAKANKILFLYDGKDKQGKRVQGEHLSSTPTVARIELKKQGIIALKIKKKPKEIELFKEKIKPEDIALFTRQMSTMLRSGVPLINAFDIVSEGIKNQTLKNLLKSLSNNIAEGNTFADSLAKYPQYFDTLYTNLVDAGEQSGTLDIMLDRIATYLEKLAALKSKIKKAMTYPISVVLIAFVVSAILLVKVVPQFEQVFSSFGSDLPAFTLFVISISEFMQAYWLIIVVTLFCAFFGLRFMIKKSVFMQKKIDQISIKLPVAGDIIQKSAVARFSRTLSTTFAAGVPLVDALSSVAAATSNSVYSKAILNVQEAVSSGQELNVAMQETKVFPIMVIQMVSIGEESGALDAMLAKSADYYEAEVDDSVDSLVSLMEPFIMSVLAVLVGGLIIAMYLPIFNIGGAIGGG